MRTDFSLVCGVDAKTIHQLKLTWPTWKQHKPELLERPMLVFYDRNSVTREAVRAIVDHPYLTLWAWPPSDTAYEQTSPDKWGNPQRHKMLAGFVHVPAVWVETPYWLKLDTDVVATAGGAEWFRPEWWFDQVAIVAPGWGYTKPANQMQQLDSWVDRHERTFPDLFRSPDLHLPAPTSPDRLDHSRICSWCAFFNTEFTRRASRYARDTCPLGHLPVPSQDGYMWYVAKRLGLPIRTVPFKKLGFQVCGTSRGLRQAVGLPEES